MNDKVSKVSKEASPGGPKSRPSQRMRAVTLSVERINDVLSHPEKKEQAEKTDTLERRITEFLKQLQFEESPDSKGLFKRVLLKVKIVKDAQAPGGVVLDVGYNINANNSDDEGGRKVRHSMEIRTARTGGLSQMGLDQFVNEFDRVGLSLEGPKVHEKVEGFAYFFK